MPAKVRVLVVDGQAIVRHATCALLSRDPTLHVIEQLFSGEEAVHEGEKLQPDLILIEFSLPGISGIEAAREILRLSPLTRIIFLSRHDSIKVAIDAVKAGAHGYVAKIDAASELHTAIRAVRQGSLFVSQRIRNQGWTEL